MDGREQQLKEKLDRILREAAQVKVELDRANGTVVGVPHYLVIEMTAHELGKQLSRQVQERHLAEMVAQEQPKAACPACGARCEVTPERREGRSVDGKLELTELKGYCPFCRRAFFPSADNAGAGRA